MRQLRRITETERSLWLRAMADAVPLPGRPPLPAAPPAPGPVPTAPEILEPPPARLPRPPRGTGLDRRTEERFRGGELAIDARLDLHGMTQAAAHRALDHFLDISIERGRRALLVITGKGGEGGGVLWTNVPRWLAEAAHRPHVLAWTRAQQRHGGTGALYILLRRRR